MQTIGNITPTATSDGHFTNGSVATGISPTLLDAAWFNTVQDELVNVLVAAGITPDPKNNAQLLLALGKLYATPAQVQASLSGIVGTTRNLMMSVTAPTATANITADEIVIGSALGGSQYRLGNFSKTINLGITGAGGMDVGAVPANGFVAIYAIYNPTSNTSALLAVNATPSSAPEIYSGQNMPAGYTASCLISVWGITSSQFVIGYQLGRKISIVRTNTLNTTTNTSGYQSFTISGVVPKNAKSISGSLTISQNSAGNGVGAVISPSASGIASLGVTAVATQGTSSNFISGEMPVITPQTLFYQTVSSASGTYVFSISSYTF